MNYYEHHIGDHLKRTVHLTAVEEGVYRRLLDRYYTTEQPLPADVRECCKLARATTKAERDAVRDVLKDFFLLGEDGHHQSRVDEEIARFKDKKTKAQRSANARWGAQRTQSEGNANAYANAMHRAPVPNPQSPDTSYSVPDGTDGKPSDSPPSLADPPDLLGQQVDHQSKSPEDLTKAELWKAGKSLLHSAGMPLAQCGSFVGKLVKDYGEVITVDAVRAAVVAQPADPAEYLKAACQRMAGKRAPVLRRNGQGRAPRCPGELPQGARHRQPRRRSAGQRPQAHAG